ncbi:MAG: hypothetical protein A3J55_04565 [Candidatus Ryanbacteria bacterium RIFCSPHIGHO2_02_FULL_45_17b]|uniref:Uncharacterized protein n=1 Tax=Candidatus Ryanbacteria bacterium RIFCSPHIGHO2_01_FULL_45_22 TaxID=1802114 RepID=A0A1G2G2F1_9BACT|nr:MAG: hypothetical protein A2719_05140 [Candidatus Ryanbacteria bacterium RIFCSPHIGHO2_01_FULL_45_22]OGZ47616.1 MAG: hypothetical protein A3J55_04565 [Candidatus Ryanbacteria bacterium RIFCSPHIGHO2_02_FULL_45_17b]
MSEYRDEARQMAKDAHWTFWKFFPAFLVAVIMLSAVGFGLNSLGLFGKTVVERKVFEHSYQRQAGLEAEIATYQATLTEIERKLTNSELDTNTRFNLEAQASMIRIKMAAAKEQLK